MQKQRFRLYRRNGTYYAHESDTGKQTSLRTKDKTEAVGLLIGSRITVPPNNNGTGFVCYSRSGMSAGFPVAQYSVRQDFEGAPDLDILPALGGKTVTVGRIRSGANQTIECQLFPDVTGWTQGTVIRLDLLAPNGLVRSTSDFTKISAVGAGLLATSTDAGFYSLKLTAINTPRENPNPTFRLSVMYQSDPIFTTHD